MNTPMNGLRVAAAVFAFVGLVQLVRLLTRFSVVIGGHDLPLWGSAVVVLIAGALSAWMWQLSRRGTI